MLVARDLSKEYRSGDNQLAVLRDVSFSIPQGAFVAIVGPSGSGKTTLLGLLAGLDTPTRGTVLLDDADLTAMDEDQRAQLRGEKVGFVFQSFQLISTLTALENVQVPLELRGERGASERARELLEPRRPGRSARPLPHAALRRRAAARRDRAGVRQLAAHPVRRRADGQSRQRDRRAHRRAARGAQPRIGDDDHPRHARPHARGARAAHHPAERRTRRLGHRDRSGAA